MVYKKNLKENLQMDLFQIRKKLVHQKLNIKKWGNYF
jgi:hypothetical protein